MIISQDDIVRFKGKYLEMPNGCYEWQDSLNKDGYGKLNVQGQMLYSHRLAYTIFKGEIPAGMCVCHSCDNPKCVNPAHLWLGTHAANMHDKVAKGRGRNHGGFKGVDNPTSKLTDDNVIEIKLRIKCGERTSDIALAFDISRPVISNIKAGRTWKHVSIG